MALCRVCGPDSSESELINTAVTSHLYKSYLMSHHFEAWSTNHSRPARQTVKNVFSQMKQTLRSVISSCFIAIMRFVMDTFQ